MRNIIIWLITISLLISLSACVNKSSNTNGEVNNNVTSVKNDEEEPENKTAIQDAVSKFVESIKNNDENTFRNLIDTDGILVIRNFISGGNGERGKDIKDIYIKENVPDNLEFPVKDEIPVNPADLFTETIIAKLDTVEVKIIEDDELLLITQTTDTLSTINMIAEILKRSNNHDFVPSIVRLGDKGFVLTEAQLVDDLPIGAFAVFVERDDKYYLKALIDLR